MQKNLEVEFKSLLTKEEYERLISKFEGSRSDLQTNHYFDTSRFSLKAIDCSFRVRERNTFEITLKRKKGYQILEKNLAITKEAFEDLKQTGYVDDDDLQDELLGLIGTQKLNNFMSLSTLRYYLPYKNGILFIDKSTYLGITDYELEYEAKSYHGGKKEFVEIINELGIQYKKADKKIKRAYNALKNIH